jgi:hypothetical protein
LDSGVRDADACACGARQLCTAGGYCVSVSCAPGIPCIDPQRICDNASNACVSPTGACDAMTPCPVFDQRLLDVGTAACTSGYCRLAPFPPAAIAGLEPTRTTTIEIDSPRTAIGAARNVEEYADEQQAQFEWVWTDTPVIAVVLDALPRSASDVSMHAIWGVSYPAPTTLVESTRRVSWSEGVAIHGGQWLAASEPAPRDVPLYFLVQAVQTGGLVALSEPTPFSIGHAWKGRGDACSDVGALPGSCEHPFRVQTCFQGACSVVCASRFDCDESAGEYCTVPMPSGLRLCN